MIFVFGFVDVENLLLWFFSIILTQPQFLILSHVVTVASVWAGWILGLSMLLLSRLWAALAPEGRWPRLEWSFWMIKTVTLWGTWRDQWEKETFSPCLSLREKQEGCARVFYCFVSKCSQNNVVLIFGVDAKDIVSFMFSLTYFAF